MDVAGGGDLVFADDFAEIRVYGIAGNDSYRAIGRQKGAARLYPRLFHMRNISQHPTGILSEAVHDGVQEADFAIRQL